MEKLLLFCSLLFISSHLEAQAFKHNDYVGAGHQTGISVTTSDSQTNSNNGFYTIDGFPITDKAPLTDAGRFLSQATLGADYETIQKVAAMGYEAWMDEQFQLPTSEYLPLMESIYLHFRNVWVNQFGQNAVFNEEGEALPFANFFGAAWWQNNMTATDLLRHKIALALSEILVVSYKTGNLEDSGYGLSYYYDILYKNAFGNYRDILKEVTLSPAMGTYLSHYTNPKSDPAINRHPDENYAREVMQLFSIGLYELNQDGTQKISDNQPIPTYSNTDIKEFAKVFTGLGGSAYWSPFQDLSNESPEWEMDFSECNQAKPMLMYEEWHQQGEKSLLNGQIVPTGQTGMKDIEDAMDNLFNHTNVGPFIGRRLIQNLVKSNPSPEYIGRVAAAFANNGQGQRGDMQAVIKAILLDPEARDCDYATKNDIGKLRSPLARYVHALRAFKVNSSANTFWDDGYDTDMFIRQTPLQANSVFNFYLPDYQPNGAIADGNQFGPEFQIHNSSSAISYGNLLYQMLFEEYHLYNLKPVTMVIGEVDVDESKPIQLDFTAEDAIANDLNALLDRLDVLLTNGNLSTNTRTIIFNVLNQMESEDVWDIRNTAVFLILLSPDYAILK